MKIEVYVSEIKKTLSIVFKGISSKPHLPILSGILLRANNGRTSLVSTDLEISFWAEMEATVLEEGEVIIPAKLFLDLISTLEEGRVTVSLVDKKIIVEAKGLTTEIVCQSSDDYPSVPRATNKGIKISSSLFQKKIDKVIASSAKDDTRPILTGILFSFKNKVLSLVATDGFRLAVNSLPLNVDIDDVSVVVPTKSVVELLKTITELHIDTFLMELDKNSKQVVFSFGTVEMSSRILDGEFPPYQQIVPNTYSTKISLPKQFLITAVKRSGLFVRDNANIVRIEVSDKLIVSAENSQLGSNMSEVEAEVEGNKMTVAFNARYLLDFLPVVESDRVDWETEGDLKPSVFKDESDPDWFQVVMPIRTQD